MISEAMALVLYFFAMLSFFFLSILAYVFGWRSAVRYWKRNTAADIRDVKKAIEALENQVLKTKRKRKG